MTSSTLAYGAERQHSLLPPPLWRAIKDGDDEARAFFDRHYSRKRYADGRTPVLFVGPGEKLVLVTPCRLALFVWRLFRSDDGQEGVNCAVFRNESSHLSSVLIRAADAVADARWPGRARPICSADLHHDRMRGDVNSNRRPWRRRLDRRHADNRIEHRDRSIGAKRQNRVDLRINRPGR